MHQVECALQLGHGQLVPHGLIQIHDRARAHAGRIVHDDVYTTPFLHGGIYQALGILRLRNVPVDGQRASAFSLDQSRRRLRIARKLHHLPIILFRHRILIVGLGTGRAGLTVVGNDACSLASKADSDAASDSLTGSGDDGNLSV